MESILITCDEPVPEIERAIRGFLARYPGTWHIQLNQRLAGGWWSVRVRTEGFTNIFLIRPTERTPDAIVGQLREALRGSQGPETPAWDGVERRSRPRS
jgi:hypothetical protein